MSYSPLILASASPRRKALLAFLTRDFQVMPSLVKERFSRQKPALQAERLALSKAQEVAGRLRRKKRWDGWVLGADTLVIKAGKILGKPKDGQDARRMLKSLSASSHLVITGIALLPLSAAQKPWVRHVSTRVWFRKLDDREIDAYVLTGEPLDKAGAYGIQGAAGAFVKKISGDYFNVVGLPLSLLAEKFKE
jgi:septum formation protein